MLYKKNGDIPLCETSTFEVVLFYVVIGGIYIFAHISISEGKTKYNVIFLYTVFFIENVVATFVWCFNVNLTEFVIFISFYLNIFFFIIGTICMIAYYKYFHPNKTKKTNVEVASHLKSLDVQH